jgi:ADP-ribose pyrophosphatase
MPLKPWELIASRKNDSLRIFDLRVDKARSPRTDEVHDFYVLESMDWVNVIPITPDNQIVLIRQYRHGTREITLEIPGGIVERADSPQEAAIRELREETGFQGSEMIPIGRVHPNPAFLNNRCYTFVAKDAVRAGGQAQDEKEDIEVLLRPLAAVPDLIREGQITHALVLAAFYRFYMEYPEGIAQRA